MRNKLALNFLDEPTFNPIQYKSPDVSVEDAELLDNHQHQPLFQHKSTHHNPMPNPPMKNPLPTEPTPKIL
jgi:hypothetical protein